jgi:carbonic anhydrase
MISFPERLISGYRTFANQRLPTEQSRYRDLSERGQAPEVMLIGCCDSRVSPEVIFDAGPGEMFVVRNVANIVPPYAPDGAAHGVSAALEFGVQVLRVKHIVVLGHAQCGGIRALAADSAPLSPGDFIGKWMSILSPTLAGNPRAAGEAEQDFITRLELAAVRRSLENLMTFPCISILADRGTLTLHGAYFGVARGSLSVLDKASGEFRKVNGAA